jgi:hypothetical protein
MPCQLSHVLPRVPVPVLPDVHGHPPGTAGNATGNADTSTVRQRRCRVNRDERDTALKLCAKALDCACADDWVGAGETVQELHTTYGGEGLQLFLIALADTLLTIQGARPSPDAVVAPMWVKPDGDVGLADDVPAPVRWAGRFIAARAADDEAGCAALWNSITNDDEFSDNILATLDVVATTINAMVRATEADR